MPFHIVPISTSGKIPSTPLTLRRNTHSAFKVESAVLSNQSTIYKTKLKGDTLTMRNIKDAIGVKVMNGDYVVAILKGKGGQKTLGVATVVANKTGFTLKPVEHTHRLAYRRYMKNHILSIMDRGADVEQPANNPEYVGGGL